MDFATYPDLLFERKGKVLQVTINRPDSLNAVDSALEHQLTRMFNEAGFDKETHVIVLTGAGRAFSAGGNLDAMQEVINRPELMLDGIHSAKQLIFQILDCPKPIIAKVNGHAIGLGATMALFCDVIFAAEKAKIADPHVRMGYVAGDGGAVIWPQLIGYARAKEFLMTGDTLLGSEAAKMGLINHAVPAEELDQRVDEFAQRLANGASRAIQWTKVSVNIGLKQLAHSIMDAAFAYEALSGRTQDHQEALNAFKEKRDPKFTGN